MEAQKMSEDIALENEQYSILLATYNGERFVEEFLKHCPWPSGADIILRDDGSSDDTLTIIQKFCAKQNIALIMLEGERLGAKNNFAKTLECLEKPYFFFADQDDIWEKEKFSTLLQAMHELEASYGHDVPLLVYSDASLMNEDGQIFSNSYLKNAMIPYGWNEQFRNVLVMPHVPGCAMLGNKSLAKAALPIAKEAVMHDAWVLQVAAALGKVKEVALPLVRYRQHSVNVFGAKKRSVKDIIKRVLGGRKPKYENIVQSQRQAAALWQHCGHLMTKEDQILCKAWAEVTAKSWLERRIIYAKYGFKKAGLVHNAVLWTCG